MSKTNNTLGKTGMMRPFTYKKVYTNQVEKVSAGIYNFKTYLDDGVILEEENLKKASMYKVGDYIREKIDEYEVENGIEPEAEEPEDEVEALAELKEEEAELDDELAKLEAQEAETNLLLNEEEAMKKYKEETGNDALTSRNTLRKDFLKWRKNNWDIKPTEI